jgi:hypothetical protein
VSTRHVSPIRLILSTFDCQRRDFASDVLRMQEAAALFTAAAIAKDDKVSFELGLSVFFEGCSHANGQTLYGL